SAVLLLPVRPQNEPVELVFGLAGPVGTRFSKVTDTLKDALVAVSYSTQTIRLSSFLPEYNLSDGKATIELKNRPEDERIRSHQDGGNALRNAVGNKAALAIRAIQEIAETCTLPPQRSAYVLHSLKRPEEVEQLRAVYDEGFFLIAVVAPRWLRIKSLAE